MAIVCESPFSIEQQEWPSQCSSMEKLLDYETIMKCLIQRCIQICKEKFRLIVANLRIQSSQFYNNETSSKLSIGAEEWNECEKARKDYIECQQNHCQEMQTSIRQVVDRFANIFNSSSHYYTTTQATIDWIRGRRFAVTADDRDDYKFLQKKPNTTIIINKTDSYDQNDLISGSTMLINTIWLQWIFLIWTFLIAIVLLLSTIKYYLRRNVTTYKTTISHKDNNGYEMRERNLV
ncbi:hypothetical protein DERF_009423 [Dermatophagoides farinae]|uniref:Uncharacterized protein n=1 Tax=Dermatophagoides farinae TaxID=6954 RepID=A0A922HWE5_DERFA|nr:hypothetical protein HUG17_7334 [Dermatophagoides farinae]KAH9510933.1 hypothetical protein DERF_009423 [Dermatophagoides farinae]